MLAYELFHNNKNSPTNDQKSQFPIKKIFYKHNKITIDEKKLDGYGSKTTKKTKQLQEWLQMPLNTIDVQKLNLPDFRTGSAAVNPYIEVYGYLKTTKLTLSIGKKSNKIIHTLDFTNNDKISSDPKEKITLKLDKKNYFLNSNTLFSEYVSSGIIDDNGSLNVKVYDKIIRKFLESAKKQKPETINRFNSVSFRIYILPDNSTIEYQKQTKKENSEQTTFTDYFGNTVSEYASTPTKNTKFLTYDDPAFSINCMKEKNFYKNLGIGDSSLTKVFTNKTKTFKISNLDWTFFDLENPDFEFKETGKGILTQLYENYRKLSKDKGPTSQSQLKVICIREKYAKQELLIDENLTMDKMKNMFSKFEDIPPSCLEDVLIDKSNENPIWNTYLYVVKNFLAANKIPKNYLLSHFNKILKQKRYDWIKLGDKSEQENFFLKSDFCLKHLSISNNA